MTQLMILTSDPIEPQALPAVLEAVHRQAQLEFFMADWWNGPGLFTNYAEGLIELQKKVGDCTGGSAFGEKAEICWRQVGEKFRVVLMAEHDLSVLLNSTNAGGAAWKPSDETRPYKRIEDFEVILWGTECIDETRSANSSTWIEARIPRKLSYPVKPHQRPSGGRDNDDFEGVFLKIKAYYDARGRPIIYRRYGLRAQLESQRRKQSRQEEQIQTTEEAKKAEETKR